jgi:hypothetical protein
VSLLRPVNERTRKWMEAQPGKKICLWCERLFCEEFTAGRFCTAGCVHDYRRYQIRESTR